MEYGTAKTPYPLSDYAFSFLTFRLLYVAFLS